MFTTMMTIRMGILNFMFISYSKSLNLQEYIKPFLFITTTFVFCNCFAEISYPREWNRKPDKYDFHPN